MQGSPNTSGHPRRPTFLSEYDSYESESYSARGRHIGSTRIMRKLKQLWNRQRYLTDDEMQSGREGQRQTHLQLNSRSSREAEDKRHEREDSGHEAEKRLHPRQVSSQDEKLNLIRKKSNRHSIQSQQPSKDSKDMEELQQIAAFNSEVENESK